jgi:uncharacterized protein YdhG (YjbR/CyaY superfamily)
MTWARQHAPETQQAITDAYTSIGRELEATVVPVGLAWQSFLGKHDQPVLHDRDQSHPTLAGSYLAACVFLAVLFEESPVGADGQVAGLEKKDQVLLQQAASGACRSIRPAKNRRGGRTARATPQTIDEYIGACPAEVQAILKKIRLTIREVVPQAVEKISYLMPAFALDGDLIYFAAFKKHIGVFPPVQGDEKLSKDLARYRGEKGNLKFPLDEPIPYGLLKRVVQFRLKEHAERVQSRRKKG